MPPVRTVLAQLLELVAGVVFVIAAFRVHEVVGLIAIVLVLLAVVFVLDPPTRRGGPRRRRATDGGAP